MKIHRVLILVSGVFAGLMLWSGYPTDAAESPVGLWESVDYVENIDMFQPGVKSFGGNLYLKQYEFKGDGTTSLAQTWENDIVTDTQSNIKAQFFTKQIGNETYLFLPWLSGDVTIRGQKPWYYVLKKVGDGGQTPLQRQSERRDKPARAGAAAEPAGGRQMGTYRQIEPVNSVKPFDDVRDKDLGGLDLSAMGNVIDTLTFNMKTIWPAAEKMPRGVDPNRLMGEAMNPGLGIRQLHQQGITGKGVNVAIIDQALYPNHPEFAGKVAASYDLVHENRGSMHGPAVTSLLVGNRCGTAPDVNVYYVAARDGCYEVDYAEGLDWIIEQSRKLPRSERIRVVSVSAAPGHAGTPAAANEKKWEGARDRAEAAGILVLDCTDDYGIISRCWLDPNFWEEPAKCTPGFRDSPTSGVQTSRVYAPVEPRTTAEEFRKGDCGYQYCGTGGLSWAIPYVAGVLAMGWQIRPELTAEQMKELLFRSAYINSAGAKIINPEEFIRLVKKTGRSGTGAARPQEVSQNPLGKWESVDFVSNMASFTPGVKSWKDNLYLKNLEFFGGGKTSGPWTWRAGTLFHPGDRSIDKYVIKEIEGVTYMFLEWNPSGNDLSYYVLRKVSGDTQSRR